MRVAGLLLVVILFFSLCFSFEDPLLQRIIKNLESYTSTFPQEKVYVHTDKPYYHVGDTIWFKGYLVDAQTNFPDSVSGVLYIDLIDAEHGKVLTSKILRAVHGFSYGNIDIPDSLHDGNYQLRAYTNWMRNFPKSIFIKNIKIYKGSERILKKDKIIIATSIADITFFPEGGDLVTNLKSRIAFKAVNISGYGVDARGVILNSKNDTIVAFTSIHLGMGYFNFTPLPGERYHASAKDVNGTIKTFMLPTAVSHGYAMALDNLTRKDEIRVFISHNYPEKKNLVILAHQSGIVQYAIDINNAAGNFVVKIPSSNFKKEGIVHFSVFDETSKPVCERLAYISTGENLAPELTTNKTEYKPNEKVTMSVSVKDSDGMPVQGNFSIAVTDESQIAIGPHGENITSYFHLTSDVTPKISVNDDIRGFIEQPGSYFDKKDGKTSIYLDILLMTQGWRRFKWEDVFDKNLNGPEHTIEQGIQFSGTVSQLNDQPIKDVVVATFMVSPKDTSSFIIQGKTDSHGKFLFSNLEFTDTTVITVAQRTKEKKLKFIFDPIVPPPKVMAQNLADTNNVENSVLNNYLIHERELAEIKSRNNKMLEEVTITAGKIPKYDLRRGMLPSAGFGTVIEVSPTKCASSISAIRLIQGNVAGVNLVLGQDQNYIAQMRGGREPLYILNGIPTDAAFLNTLNPCDVEKVEIYKGPITGYSTGASAGVIAFLLRKGPSTHQSKQTYLTKLVRMGYSAPREFYSPRYDSRPTVDTDYRSTIYWNPTVITNAEGKATVEFWNSSAPTKIRAILEGLSYKGQTVTSTITYPVE